MADEDGMAGDDGMAEDELTPADHERSDIGARTIWIGAPALIVGVVGLALLVYELYPGATVDRTLALPLRAYPEPQLQTDPVKDMRAYRQAELQRLNDPHREPIAAAMRDVVEHGIGDWPTRAPPSPPQDPSR